MLEWRLPEISKLPIPRFWNDFPPRSEPSSGLTIPANQLGAWTTTTRNLISMLSIIHTTFLEWFRAIQCAHNPRQPIRCSNDGYKKLAAKPRNISYRILGPFLLRVYVSTNEGCKKWRWPDRDNAIRTTVFQKTHPSNRIIQFTARCQFCLPVIRNEEFLELLQ